jgi:hypothetical protein
MNQSVWDECDPKELSVPGTEQGGGEQPSLGNVKFLAKMEDEQEAAG